MGGQFEPKLVVNLHRNWVVNLTVFSTVNNEIFDSIQINENVIIYYFDFIRF